MRGKRRLMGVVVSVGLAVSGLATGCQSSDEKNAATAQSDCQAVNELLAYQSETTMSAMNGQKPNKEEETARMQGYVDKISESSLKSKTQRLVDNWKASVLGGGSASNDAATFIKQQAELGKQARVMTRELERLCPTKK